MTDHNKTYDAYFAQGIEALQKNRLEEAEKCFLEAIQIDGTRSGAHKNLAILYLRMSSDRAIDSLIQVSFLDPADREVIATLRTIRPALFDFPKADVVFYTGTPWLTQKFCPDDLTGKGLGGSEAAFITVAKAIKNSGRTVVCFCNTPNRALYDGILYVPVNQFFLYPNTHPLDVLVSSRYIYPFVHGLKPRKTILWLHDTVGLDIGPCPEPLYSLVDHYIGLSNYQIDQLVSQYGFPRNRFVKLANGFDPATFDLPAVTRDRHSLIYLSRPERGLGETLLIFSRLKKKFTNLTLHVCSYSMYSRMEDDPQLKPHIETMQQDGVYFHGQLSRKELAKLLSRIQISLYPNVSTAETSCMAALESMASGAPMITSDRGALPETVPQDIGGRIVAFSGDREDFLRRMENEVSHLLDHPAELSQLSERAHHHAWSHYRWDDVCTKFVQLLDSLK
jgi:glycosyltransferase involved in cell wall biosynthesis